MSESDLNGPGVTAQVLEGQAGEMPVAPAELVRRADGLLKQGETAQAEPLYRQALDRDPGQLRAYQQLAAIALGRDDIEGALALLAAGLERKPTNAALIHARSKALRQAGRFGEALDALRPALDQQPPLPDLVIQAADLARLAGDLDESRRLLLALGLSVKGVGSEAVRLARAYREADRRIDAIELMRAAEAAAPDDPGILGFYADLLMAFDRDCDPQELERVLVRRNQMDPGHLRTLLALASLREEAGHKEEAVALLEQARTRHPTHPKPYLLLSALARADSADAAIAWLDAGLEGGAEPNLLLREKGRLLTSQGALEAAESTQRSLLALGGKGKGGSAAARLDLIATLRRQGRLKEAMELIGTEFPERADVREGLRLVGDLRTSGRTADALDLIQKILASHPHDTTALLVLVAVLQAKEAYGEAQAVVEQVLKIDPTLGRGYSMLADIQWNARSATAALATLDLGFAVAGPSAELYATAARIHFHRGEDAAAAARLREGLEAFPGNRNLLRAAIDQCIVSGRFGDLDPLLDALPDTPEQRSAKRVFKARCAMAHLRYEDAVTVLTEAEAETPDNYNVWIHHLLAAMPRLRMDDARRAEKRLRGLVRDDPDHVRAARKVGFFRELFNDMLTDPAAAVAGSDAVARNDLDRLSTVVRDFPDSTGVALALVVALRRAGRLPGPKPGRAVAASPIPRRVVQFWDAPEPPEDLRAFIESWGKLNPNWTHTLFSVDSAREFLAQNMPGPVLQAFQAARHPAHKADIFRLAVLLRDGGIYADIDDRCMGPLDQLCAGASLVLRHEHLGSIGNNFIACRPGHPLVGKALMGAVKATLEGHSEAIWLSTGPGLLTRAFAQLYATDAPLRAEMETQTRLLPDFVLRHFVAFGLHAVYKSTEQHWVQQQFGGRPAASRHKAAESEREVPIALAATGD